MAMNAQGQHRLCRGMAAIEEYLSGGPYRLGGASA